MIHFLKKFIFTMMILSVISSKNLMADMLLFYNTAILTASLQHSGTTTSPTLPSQCTFTPIINDSGFSDIYPSQDIPWSASDETVKGIENAFNFARAQDPTISQKLIMPSQQVWDAMTLQQKGLYILNNERYYRGLKPYEGATNDVIDVATSYAQYLYDNDVFGHYEDGSDPWERLDSKPRIANNTDFFAYAENLYVHASSNQYLLNPTAKALYAFIYDDASSDWGHRKFCLAKGLNDDSGVNGQEGLVGFAIKIGTAYEYFASNYKNTIFVMNAIDPSSSWNHSDTIKSVFCTPSN